MTFLCNLFAVSLFLAGASLEAMHADSTKNAEENSSASDQSQAGDKTPIIKLRNSANETDAKVVEKAKALEKQRQTVNEAVGKNGDRALDTLMKDADISKLVEEGDPDKLAGHLGATEDKDKEAVQKLIAKNMAEKDPAKLYAHYFKQHIESQSAKKDERNTKLDKAVDEQIGKLKEKHQELLKQFETAGVRGGKPEWRAIRLEMADQAIRKANDLEAKPGASDTQKQEAWAAAAKATDGLMSSLTNRPALAKALLADSSESKGNNLGRFLGKAAEVSTMSPVPPGRENLLSLNRSETTFQTAFLKSWNAQDGGRQRIVQWNQDVASGKKDVLDSKYSGWVDHAIETQNVNATWLAKANQGKWQYESGGKTFELTSKQSLSTFFAAMDVQKGNVQQAFAAMDAVQKNIEARARTNESTKAKAKGVSSSELPVSLGNEIVNLDAVAAHLSPTQASGSQNPVQPPSVEVCTTGTCQNRRPSENPVIDSCSNGACESLR
jgi:hypothetical protein